MIRIVQLDKRLADFELLDGKIRPIFTGDRRSGSYLIEAGVVCNQLHDHRGGCAVDQPSVVQVISGVKKPNAPFNESRSAALASPPISDG